MRWPRIMVCGESKRPDRPFITWASSYRLYSVGGTVGIIDGGSYCGRDAGSVTAVSACKAQLSTPLQAPSNASISRYNFMIGYHMIRYHCYKLILNYIKPVCPHHSELSLEICSWSSLVQIWAQNYDWALIFGNTAQMFLYSPKAKTNGETLFSD